MTKQLALSKIKREVNLAGLFKQLRHTHKHTHTHTQTHTHTHTHTCDV